MILVELFHTGFLYLFTTTRKLSFIFELIHSKFGREQSTI